MQTNAVDDIAALIIRAAARVEMTRRAMGHDASGWVRWANIPAELLVPPRYGKRTAPAFDKRENQEVILRMRSGDRIKQIALDLKISPQRVSQIAKRDGWTEDDAALARECRRTLKARR